MSKDFDVFLSYNREDQAAVLDLAEKLKGLDVCVWLDVWELPPGRPWQPLLEQAIERTKTAAVLIGPSGVGPWQDMEMRVVLNRFVERRSPVIPVLLPESPASALLPAFLAEFTWVDLRSGVTDEGLKKLIWGIRGESPVAVVTAASPPDRATTSAIPRTYVDPETGLMWTIRDNGTGLTWQEAVEYVKRFRLGGYSDWRLPTVDELEELHERGSENPIRAPFRVHALMWSSTTSTETHALFYNYWVGMSGTLPKDDTTSQCRVFCVRSVEPLSANSASS